MQQSRLPERSSTNRGLVASASQQTKGLALNIIEVVLNKTELEVFQTPYSKAEFDDGKAKHPDYFFYRFNDVLYAWERRDTEDRLPDQYTLTTVDIDEHAPVLKKIVEESLVQHFFQKGFKVRKLRYSSSWEVTLQKEDGTKFGYLNLIPTMIFSVTNLFSGLSGRQVIALSIQKRYSHRFGDDEAAINDQGIDTRDWHKNYKGEVVASSMNRRLYLDAINQGSRYHGFLQGAESGRSEYKFLQNSWKAFNQIKDMLFLPDGLQVTDFFFALLPNSSFESETIQKPQYFYYNEKTKSGLYDQALKELKPYSYDLFRDRRIRILVITPAEYEGVVDEYLAKIKKKLDTFFHLSNVRFEMSTIDIKQGYLSALDDLDPTVYDLAIVVVSQQHKKLEIKKSPYYILKAKLLNQRLPTQDLTIEVLKKRDEFIEKNIALNIYSKLGGTAWTIEKIERNVSELIIGIGSTTDESANTIIGFANIFDYNGTYLMGDCSQLSTKLNYSKNLENYLVKGLRQAFAKKNITTGDQIRLVFHLFKEAGSDYEIKAITNALRHFSAYSIKYALVHLSYNHNYRIFLDEGLNQPARGTFVQVTTFQGLLYLGGNSTVPVLMRVDKRSGYKDIYSITKQALFFSHLSHRTFKPPSKPVTIKYPSIMAKIVSELRQISNWDPDVLNQLSDTLWFI